MSGAAYEVESEPYCVNPLTVAVKVENGEKRLVLDARHLNCLIEVPACKYEGIDHYLTPISS